MANLPYVAVDKNAERVAARRAEGYPVFYGDAAQPEVLRGMGIEDGSIVIVTLDDLQATERLVTALHEAYPRIEILARAADATQCRELQHCGATVTVSETLEASIELARAALDRVGGTEVDADALLVRFKERYYAGIAGIRSHGEDDRV
jgi:voltage-gated potassium channel Kch